MKLSKNKQSIKINRRPIIGVFINEKFFQRSKMRRFAQKLVQANEKTRCTLYFFCLKNINWQEKTICGQLLNKHKQWQKELFPFPDIIYDRGTGFTGKEKAMVEAARKRLKKIPDIQFINSCKLDKWQVHQRLNKYAALKKYLPPTFLSKGLADIEKKIGRYKYLFLKSADGSGGKNVFALEKKTSGFVFSYFSKNKHRKVTAPTLKNLPQALKNLGLKPEGLVLQQGVQLLKLNGCPWDLRVLLVKNNMGTWETVYTQARVAPEGAVITNAALGGKVKNYSTVYSVLKKGYPSLPTEAQISRISLLIARYLEKEFGLFGEIGIDLGIDESGKVWFLEANSKPSKLPEKKLEGTEGISPQFLKILEYACYLYQKKA
ncbi:MAG: YheC/YheD family protein [Firmicutes bacterium]|nr:YheC/YheD family protein [Bacillota bacterium]